MPTEVRYAKHGNPARVLRLESVRRRPLRPGEVRVAILAAPVHLADLKDITREAGFGNQPLPAVPGYEGIGEVVATARGVSLKAGQRVYLPLGCGAWRTEIQLPASGLIRAPSGGDPVQLSLLPINLPTAWLLLKDVVRLRRGDWVVQNAANSNVGVFLNSLASQWGINVANIVRRPDAAAPLRAAGAQHIVWGDDAYSSARALIGAPLAALAIDAIGGAATSQIATCLRPGGTVANYGLLSGQPCQMTPQQLMFDDLTLRGFFMIRHLMRRSPEQVQKLYDRMSSLVVSGRVQSQIAAVYPLTAVHRAVEHAARSGADRAGKIVLTPG